MLRRKKEGKRGAIELETLAWWLIGFAVFVLMVIGYLIARGRVGGVLEYIKNLFRFG